MAWLAISGCNRNIISEMMVFLNRNSESSGHFAGEKDLANSRCFSSALSSVAI